MQPQLLAGLQVATLQEAHDLLEQILNSHIAPLAFGLALLLTGQMSTFTSTIAGQVVMSGFLGLSSSTLSRRLSTRALAVVPALYVQIHYGTEGTYKCAATSLELFV
jgi:manganese transport protein